MWYKDGRLALDLTVLVLFLFEVVSLSSVQCSQDVWQYAVLYTGKDGSGEPLTIMEEDSENLEQLGFGNAQSECHVGAWVHLTSRFSEKYGSIRYLHPPGCNNQAIGKSIRFVGDPSNYTRDSLTFFADLGFTKAKEVVYTDGNVKMASIGSMAATGSSDWTIYKDPNYGGDSYCIKWTFRDYSHFIVQLYGPSFVKGFEGNLGNDWISSVKKGCHSSSVLSPIKN